jgi:hypothetical protein
MRDWLFVSGDRSRFSEPTGEHLTGDALRSYLRGSDALRAEARMQGISEEDALERLVEIAGRANGT